LARTFKSTRETMLYAVSEIFENKAYTQIVLDNIFKRNDYSSKDRSLITAVVNETVRMKKTVDHVIGTFSKIPLKNMDGLVLNVLRIACTQLMYFDRIPAFAIVDESVRIVKKRRKYLTGFTNAVLRKIGASKDSITFPDIYTAVSYEEWMASRWRNTYGDDFAIDFMRKSNINPGTSIRANRLKADFENVCEKLTGMGYEIEHQYPRSGILVLKKASGIIESELYKSGLIVYQDQAAAAVCEFLDPTADSRVLDMCAAPGGKTFYLAQLMQNTGHIAARDIKESKIARMQAEGSRLGVKNVSFEVSDASITNENDVDSFDRVLADVPCSGTGIIRKKPEIKWNRKPEDISSLNEIQRKILANAFRYLKPGGELVYSTCSVEPEENEAIVEGFLGNEKHARLISFDNKAKYLKLFPNIDDTDGFFAAKIRKCRPL